MVPTASLLLGLALNGGAVEADLSRVFVKGAKLTYEVESSLLAEQKGYPFTSFLPFELEIGYRFSIAVREVREDGFATVVYERPEMRIVEGETAESPPVKNVEKVAWRYELTLSPINEITGIKDLNPKPVRPGGRVNAARSPSPQDVEPSLLEVLGVNAMIRELHALALFTGNLDSALDLAPKLPFEPVRVGETWQRTVSYQPRQLAGTDRQAVQRLDTTYTYRGLVASGGRRVHRIDSTISLDTDAALWVNQVLGMKPAESGLSAIKLKLETKTEFDLDEKTRQTLRATAESNGGFTIEATALPNRPVVEERITGRSILRLVEPKL